MIAAERRDGERTPSDAGSKEGLFDEDDDKNRPDTATTDAGEDSRPQTAEEEVEGGQPGVELPTITEEALQGRFLYSTDDAEASAGAADEATPSSSSTAPPQHGGKSKEDLLRELMALEEEAEKKHAEALGKAEQGALVDLGPRQDRPGNQTESASGSGDAEERSRAKSRSSTDDEGRQEIRELETSVATLKERLKERNAQKRDLLNELMEARKLVWEYKQEATKAKLGIKHLLQDCGKSCADVGLSIEIPDMDAPPEQPQEEPPARESRTLSPRGSSGKSGPSNSGPSGGMTKSKSTSELASMTIQQYVQTQDSELRKSISKLAEARMVAHAYIRMIEERTDVIRQLEGELEKTRMKSALSNHPCGEIFLSERMEMMRNMMAARSGGGEEGGTMRGSKSGPLSMPSLREDPEQESEEPMELTPKNPAPGPSSSMGSSSSSSSSSSSAAHDSTPEQAASSSSGATRRSGTSKFTFQQLSILTHTLESVVCAYAFRNISNYADIQAAAIKLQAAGRGRASRKAVDERRKWKQKEDAVGVIVSKLEKMVQFANSSSFTTAVAQDPERCLHAVVRHLKGYVGIHFATELLQSQMKVHLARKVTTSAALTDSVNRSRTGVERGRPATVPALPLKQQLQHMASIPAATENHPPIGQSYSLEDKGNEMRTVSSEQVERTPPMNQAFDAKNTVHFFKTMQNKAGRQNPDRIKRPPSQPPPAGTSQTGKPRIELEIPVWPYPCSEKMPISDELAAKTSELRVVLHDKDPDLTAAQRSELVAEVYTGLRTNPLLNRSGGQKRLNPRTSNNPLSASTSLNRTRPQTEGANHPRRGAPMQTISTDSADPPSEWQQWAGSFHQLSSEQNYLEGDDRMAVTTGPGGQQLFYPASNPNSRQSISEQWGEAGLDPLNGSIVSNPQQQMMRNSMNASTTSTTSVSVRPLKGLPGGPPSSGPSSRSGRASSTTNRGTKKKARGPPQHNTSTTSMRSRSKESTASNSSTTDPQHKHLHRHFHVFLPRATPNHSESLGKVPNLEPRPLRPHYNDLMQGPIGIQ
ncbi:unnamed protein product [Amoebophrya sp. A120]|nr:unnamed protein product [Amoebophrya sp. A120]|eukprot:GSA120T00011356001.1